MRLFRRRELGLAPDLSSEVVLFRAADDLQQLWRSIAGEDREPHRARFASLLNRYPLSIAHQAVIEAAKRAVQRDLPPKAVNVVLDRCAREIWDQLEGPTSGASN